MRKRIVGGLLGLLLAVTASFAIGVSPASAHWDNSVYSAYGCGSTRPSEEFTMEHAHVVTMGVYSNGVSWVRSACQYQAEDLQCGWIAETQAWGGVTYHFVWSGYTPSSCWNV